ncbi:hypothetical protein BDZ91DRAFT_123395 [Kalaharituber pfeilii]|nr:hypothetical protein BDZ91DRAFT_123395 [Kalaharituber pfeilii]
MPRKYWCQFFGNIQERRSIESRHGALWPPISFTKLLIGSLWGVLLWEERVLCILRLLSHMALTTLALPNPHPEKGLMHQRGARLSALKAIGLVTQHERLLAPMSTALNSTAAVKRPDYHRAVTNIEGAQAAVM